jgi:hypothetical protein
MEKIDFTKDKKALLAEVNLKLANIPDEISVNVILKGEGAKKFHFVKSILTSAYPELDEDDIDKFIVRSGVEREMARFSNIWQDE